MQRMPELGALRVVLIDDSPQFLAMLEMFLGSIEGLEVVVVGNDAREGPALVRAHDADVVVLDLDLGRTFGGREGLALLRRECPDVKVVILSAYSDPAIQTELLELGADE